MQTEASRPRSLQSQTDRRLPQVCPASPVPTSPKPENPGPQASGHLKPSLVINLWDALRILSATNLTKMTFLALNFLDFERVLYWWTDLLSGKDNKEKSPGTGSVCGENTNHVTGPPVPHAECEMRKVSVRVASDDSLRHALRFVYVLNVTHLKPSVLQP